ncbi:MAG: LemA family protein [Eubacteriales bacterium]|nr:LemA family protein [Eubacteriales bacterium]
MPLIRILLFIIGIILILVFSSIHLHNRLVEFNERCLNSLSQIGIQQQSRWDALTQLAKAVKRFSEHEYDTLLKLIETRSPQRPNSAEEINADGRHFDQALGQIFAVAEQYPELKSHELFKQAMRALESYEENVRFSRMAYNDTVTRYNRAVRQFPSRLVAKRLGFQARGYLETAENVKSMPDLQF